MHDTYERGFTTPEDGETDTERIRAAIDSAKQTGINKTVIPRYNSRSKSLFWTVDAPIQIPSDFVLELDNCEIRFTGGGAFEIGGQAAAEHSRVQLVGRGNALLTADEQMLTDHLVRIENAEHVSVSGIALKNRHTRGVLCRCVTLTTIKDVWFLNEPVSVQNGLTENCAARNHASGIAVVDGCDNVMIENIFGTTYGDTVTVSTFSDSADSSEKHTLHDIFVRNVRSNCFVFSNVRLQNAKGGLLSGITVEGVTDLSHEGSFFRARAAVSVGGAAHEDCAAAVGETRNITVKNVVSRGACAVELLHSVQNITVADVTVRADGGSALGCGESLLYNNIYLCNVKFEPRRALPYPIEEVKKEAYIETPLFSEENFYPYRAVCNMREMHGFNFKINGVYGDMVDNLLALCQ